MQNFRPCVSKRCSLPHRPPLPVFKCVVLPPDETSINRRRYVGKFNGFCVVVENDEDMVELYTMGYFGKGSLSSGYPSFEKKKSLQTAYSHNELITKIDKREVETPGSTPEVEESLHLMLEEAFFLSYALDILDVHHNDESMALESMWTQFREVLPNFVPRYIAYHYFRAKGWVVRPGIKFGGDFTLYKEGPPFYHASFVVLLSYSSNETERHQNFNTLFAHYRAVEVVKKDLLICQIVAPLDLVESDLNNLKKFKISEYLFERWTASENRE